MADKSNEMMEQLTQVCALQMSLTVVRYCTAVQTVERLRNELHGRLHYSLRNEYDMGY